MKKVLKKLLICICLFLILFNFMMIESNYVYAAVSVNSFTTETGNIFSGLGEDITSLLSGLVGVLTWIQRLPLALAPMLLQGVAGLVGNMQGTTDGSTIILLTPYEILFNKLHLTSIDFFNLSEPDSTTAVGQIRQQIVKWYYIMRIIAIAILLAILIFVGIRMTITTIASEKAIYKKALFDWATSLALVFFLHYLIRGILWINTGLVSILDTIANLGTNPMNDLLGIMNNLLFHYDFLVAVTSIIVFIFITIQTIMFLVNYIKRMITLAFLIIISPLITITYSIDKMGDQKAQALNTWLKDFIFTILVQPFHCILYLVFASTAISIIGSGSGGTIGASLLAILCIHFVWKGEDIVRKIFGFGNNSSLATAAASGAVVGSMISKAGSIGKGAASGIKFAKNTKMGQKLGSKLSNVRTSKFQKKAMKQMGLSGKFGNLSDSDKESVMSLATGMKENSIGTKMTRPIKKASTAAGNFKRKVEDFAPIRAMKNIHNSGFAKKVRRATFAATSAVLTASMMGAMPDSNPVTAIGAGYAAGKSTYSGVKRMQDNKKEKFEENIMKAWNRHCDINGGNRNSREGFNDWYNSTYQNGKVLNDYSSKNMGKEKENAVKNLQEDAGVKKEDLADIIARLQRAILAKEPYDPSKLFSGYRNENGAIDPAVIAAAVAAYASKFNESIVYKNATDYNEQMNRFDITADDAIDGITDSEFKSQLTPPTQPETPDRPQEPPVTPVVSTEEDEVNETKVTTVEEMENDQFELVKEELHETHNDFGGTDDMPRILAGLEGVLEKNIKDIESNMKLSLGNIGTEQEKQLEQVMNEIKTAVKNINPESGSLDSQINNIVNGAMSKLDFVPENKRTEIQGQLTQYTNKQVAHNYVTNNYGSSNSNIDEAKLRSDLEKVAKKSK